MLTSFSSRRVPLLIALLSACAPAEKTEVVARGRGLEVVALPASSEAAVYEAAIRAGFDVAPGLALYLHPRRLPRSAGMEGGEPVTAGLATKLRTRGVLQGICEPKRDTGAEAPRCNVAQAGYIIRASDVLRVAKDTLQMYFAAERFATSSGTKQPPFHFEKIYQLIPQGTGWRVVREARVTDDRS